MIWGRPKSNKENILIAWNSNTVIWLF